MSGTCDTAHSSVPREGTHSRARPSAGTPPPWEKTTGFYPKKTTGDLCAVKVVARATPRHVPTAGDDPGTGPTASPPRPRCPHRQCQAQGCGADFLPDYKNKQLWGLNPSLCQRTSPRWPSAVPMLPPPKQQQVDPLRPSLAGRAPSHGPRFNYQRARGPRGGHRVTAAACVHRRLLSSRVRPGNWGKPGGAGVPELSRSSRAGSGHRSWPWASRSRRLRSSIRTFLRCSSCSSLPTFSCRICAAPRAPQLALGAGGTSSHPRHLHGGTRGTRGTQDQADAAAGATEQHQAL